ncbi:hypothetical protein D3C78_1463990 [compost metagenome]
MARKSRTGLQVRFFTTLGSTAWLGLTASRVWPSGADLATNSVPIAPPAPVLFSTMTACPYFAPSFSATIRAVESTTPPAENGTMIRMGRLGKAVSCAYAGMATSVAAPRERPRTWWRVNRLIFVSCWYGLENWTGVRFRARYVPHCVGSPSDARDRLGLRAR